MTVPKNIPLTIPQGTTYRKKINWYGGGKVIREIDDVVEGCPTRIKITSHGLIAAESTPIKISDVKGARNLNSDEYQLATFVDSDYFDIEASTQGQNYEAGSGCIQYFAPKDLTGWTARMDIRADINDTVPILSLTSPVDLVIDLTTAEIEIVILAAVTAALDFEDGVYDLELIDSSGDVTRLTYGDVALSKEVTRT